MVSGGKYIEYWASGCKEIDKRIDRVWSKVISLKLIWLKSHIRSNRIFSVNFNILNTRIRARWWGGSFGMSSFYVQIIIIRIALTKSERWVATTHFCECNVRGVPSVFGIYYGIKLYSKFLIIKTRGMTSTSL